MRTKWFLRAGKGGKCVTRLISAAISNVGNVRLKNEDRFYLNGVTAEPHNPSTFFLESKQGEGLYAICDGMGGESNGEVASAIAIETLSEYHHRMNPENADFHWLANEYWEDANGRICAEIERHGGERMGSTLVALSIHKGLARIYNIGDSRAYSFIDDRLTQISRDHTSIRRMIEMGILTEESARKHPDRHRLSQHLGIFHDEMIIEPFVTEPFPINHGDVFLLCSDGLTDMLTDADIQAILQEHANPEEAAEGLMKATLQHGGKDNTTVLLVRVD